MTAGTCTTPMLCVGSLAVALPEQPWPRPTSVTVQVPSCWTTWHVAAMNPACPHASTWAGVSTIVAIMKMPELSVIVRPEFTMSMYTMLSTGNRYLNTPQSKSPIAQKPHFLFTQSSEPTLLKCPVAMYDFSTQRRRHPREYKKYSAWVKAHQRHCLSAGQIPLL